MDRKLVVLLMIFFISFAFFAGLTLFNKPLTDLIRAKEDSAPSATNSKIIAWPLSSLQANGISESVINVFVISQSHKPISDRNVSLNTTLGALREANVATDNNGRATFHITSTTPGVADIEAIVEPNIKLNQKISIQFE